MEGVRYSRNLLGKALSWLTGEGLSFPEADASLLLPQNFEKINFILIQHGEETFYWSKPATVSQQ